MTFDLGRPQVDRPLPARGARAPDRRCCRSRRGRLEGAHRVPRRLLPRAPGLSLVLAGCRVRVGQRAPPASAPVRYGHHEPALRGVRCTQGQQGAAAVRDREVGRPLDRPAAPRAHLLQQTRPAALREHADAATEANGRRRGGPHLRPPVTDTPIPHSHSRTTLHTRALPLISTLIPSHDFSFHLYSGFVYNLESSLRLRTSNFQIF